MTEPTIDEQLAARRKLRDDATARQLANPCPGECGHGHLTAEQLTAWGLWSVLRRTGRVGKEHVAAALEALADPIPNPEVLARPAAVGEIPKTAQQLYDLAITHGWYGSITYSRGPVTHSRTGKFLRMVDSICVRLARQGNDPRARTMQRVVAGWTDGAFAKATVWDAGQPARILDAEPVKAHVRTPTERIDRP